MSASVGQPLATLGSAYVVRRMFATATAKRAPALTQHRLASEDGLGRVGGSTVSVRCSLDQATRIAVAVIEGDATGRDVAKVILAKVEARPWVASWDWIHDLRNASGEVSHDDVARIAEGFAQGIPPRRSVLTAFITFDPSFELWARTMDPLFANRSHVVVRSLEGAVAMILRNRAA